MNEGSYRSTGQVERYRCHTGWDGFCSEGLKDQGEQVTQATMCQGFTCSPHCLKRLKLRFLLPGRWGPRATTHRLTQANPGAPTPSKGAKVNTDTHTHAQKSKHMMGIHANKGRFFPSLCAEKTAPNRQIVLKLAQIKVRSVSYSATDDGGEKTLMTHVI